MFCPFTVLRLDSDFFLPTFSLEKISLSNFTVSSQLENNHIVKYQPLLLNSSSDCQGSTVTYIPDKYRRQV
jgi:hypothetical protein